jgi:Helicase conserved C-terminal domain
MEPGTGKTKSALDAVAIQAIKGRVERVVVFGPLAALPVWEDEIEEHFPWQCSVETWDEMWVANPKLPLRKGVCFYLLNYDKVSFRNRRKSRWLHPYLKEIEKFDPDLLILDESHRCKRAGSIRARKLWQYVAAQRAHREDGRPYVYLLTGTPNPKGYIDIFAQYRIMDPTIFGTTKAGFEDDHCTYGVGRNKYRIVRYRQKAKLLRKIQDHAFIITKEEALDLPPLMPPTVIRVPLPRRVRAQYNAMAEDFVTRLDDGEVITAANAGARRIRLQQITGGFTTKGVSIHDEKVRYATDLLRDLGEASEHVVVYARFLPEVAAMARAAEACGFLTTAITGATKSRVRADAVRAFQKRGPGKAVGRPMALVFQVRTGSLAITLTAAAHVLFYSLPDGWEDYWQALSRLDRAGQTRSISHYYLLAPGTVDMRQLDALREKRDMHAELMGNPRGFLLGE